MAAFVELLGQALVQGTETVKTAEHLATAEVVGLYFSASWCGPVRHDGQCVRACC